MPDFNTTTEMQNSFTAQLHKDLKNPNLPVSMLRAGANKEFERVNSSGNTVLISTLKVGDINKGKMADRNNNGTIATTGMEITQEEFLVDQYADFSDPIANKVINKVSGLVNISGQLAVQRNNQLEQVMEHQLASKLLLGNIHNIISAVETTVASAVTKGASTFTVANATGIEGGDIAHIDTPLGTIVVLINSVSGTTITIETDEAFIPQGGVLDNLPLFQSIVTELPNIESGAILKTDSPVTVTSETFYDHLIETLSLPSNHHVTTNNMRVFLPTKLSTLLKKKDSAVVSNDLLGKNVIQSGVVKQIDGALVMSNGNGVCREVNGQKRYLIACYKDQESINSIKWFSDIETHSNPNNVGSSFVNGLQVWDAKVCLEASKTISLMWVTI